MIISVLFFVSAFATSKRAGKQPQSALTAKQVVAMSRERNPGGSFASDYGSGAAYERAQFELLQGIKARGLARTVHYPRQYNNPKNEVEAQSQWDSKYLLQFHKVVESAGLKPNGRCVKLYNEIMGWKEDYFKAELAAEDDRVLERLEGIKQRAIERQANGGNLYPRRVAGQQDKDALALRKKPRGPKSLKLWKEIEKWKDGDEPSHREFRAEGVGPRRKGRGAFAEPSYNREAREYERQQRAQKRQRRSSRSNPQPEPESEAESEDEGDELPEDLEEDEVLPPFNPGPSSSGAGSSASHADVVRQEARQQRYGVRLRRDTAHPPPSNSAPLTDTDLFANALPPNPVHVPAGAPAAARSESQDSQSRYNTRGRGSSSMASAPLTDTDVFANALPASPFHIPAGAPAAARSESQDSQSRYNTRARGSSSMALPTALDSQGVPLPDLFGGALTDTVGAPSAASDSFQFVPQDWMEQDLLHRVEVKVGSTRVFHSEALLLAILAFACVVLTFYIRCKRLTKYLEEPLLLSDVEL